MLRYYEEESLTQFYAKYRGVYPKEAADYVIKHAFENKLNHDKNHKIDQMVEVGCGSGQCTKLLAPYFKHVSATDVSPNQIKMANQCNAFSHVTYAEGTAEEVKADDGSVDLLVAAECAHWLDLKRFLAEAQRVLKPDGTLAIICYYFPDACPAGGAREPYENLHYMTRQEALDKSNYDREAYAELEALYPNIYSQIPTQHKTSTVFKSTKSVSLAVYKAMLRTADAIQSADAVEEFIHLLKKAWELDENVDEATFIVDLQFKFRVIVAKDLLPFKQFIANL